MNQKAPVVLVHGMWSTPDTLSDVREAFEEQGYTVYTPRLPMHYPLNEMSDGAKKELANTGMNEYVESVVRFIKGLDQKPILLGHSMGALIAQLVAAKVECEKLIVMSSAPPAGMMGMSWSVVRTFGHNMLKFPLWKLTTEMRLQNVRYGIANTQNLATQQDILESSTLESGRVTWQIGMSFLYRNSPTKINYAAIKCPILIVSGTADKITPIGIQRKLKEHYQGKAKLVEIKGACHWIIGGSFFPQVTQNIFSWLEAQPVELKRAA